MSHLLISVYPRSAVNRAWKLDMTSNRGNRELYYGLGTKMFSLSLSLAIANFHQGMSKISQKSAFIRY